MSRTESPKIGTEVAHVTRDSRTPFQGQRSLAGGGDIVAASMGGAAGTAGTAAAVPLLREVRQDKVLPYHILVKKSQTYW